MGLVVYEELDVCKLGLVRGMVTDDKDPLKLCRVRVRVPIVHGMVGCDNFRPDNELPWAYPSLPANMMQVPKVKDFVWVMFENNDVHMPVYMGVVLGKNSVNNDKPVVLGSNPKGKIEVGNYEANYDGNNKGTIFETVGGFSFTYDDGNSSNRSDGKVVLYKGNTNVEVKGDGVRVDVSGSVANINSKGIEFLKGNAKISTEGDKISISVGNSVITLSGSNIVLSIGGSSVTLTGSQLTLVSPIIHENP